MPRSLVLSASQLTASTAMTVLAAPGIVSPKNDGELTATMRVRGSSAAGASSAFLSSAFSSSAVSGLSWVLTATSRSNGPLASPGAGAGSVAPGTAVAARTCAFAPVKLRIRSK
ncbi:MAG TPA: hypothetical protein DCZ72_09050 [Armatimonadetes bacterium]|nr:hypothetical protein [Armatimonadota bacterium]